MDDARDVTSRSYGPLKASFDDPCEITDWWFGYNKQSEVSGLEFY